MILDIFFYREVTYQVSIRFRSLTKSKVSRAPFESIAHIYSSHTTQQNWTDRRLHHNKNLFSRIKHFLFIVLPLRVFFVKIKEKTQTNHKRQVTVNFNTLSKSITSSEAYQQISPIIPELSSSNSVNFAHYLFYYCNYL